MPDVILKFCARNLSLAELKKVMNSNINSVVPSLFRMWSFSVFMDYKILLNCVQKAQDQVSAAEAIWVIMKAKADC